MLKLRPEQLQRLQIRMQKVHLHSKTFNKTAVPDTFNVLPHRVVCDYPQCQPAER